jgi:hypothetical protein
MGWSGLIARPMPNGTYEIGWFRPDQHWVRLGTAPDFQAACDFIRPGPYLNLAEHGIVP